MVGMSTEAPTAQGRAVRQSTPATASSCSVEGCEAAGRRMRGYCRAHYERWRMHGTATPFAPVEPLAGEEWRPVARYDRLYSVSNLGRIRRERPAEVRPAASDARRGGGGVSDREDEYERDL